MPQHPFDRPTPESIATARAAQARERAAFTEKTGVRLTSAGVPARAGARDTPAREVLMIDDDQDAVAIFGSVLRSAGYSVRTAREGAEGLASARAVTPDAIILDARMPRVDGLAFLRQFRADARGEHVPVAVVTGDYLMEDALLFEFKTLGAVVRFKPLWSEDLVELIEGLSAQA